MFIFFTKSQLSLFDAPVHVGQHVRKDGTVVKPHMRIQKVAVKQHSLFGDHHAAAPAPVKRKSKLDSFVAKHGGADALAATIRGFNPQQQNALLEQMAKVGGVDAAGVRKLLGMGEAAAVADVAAPVAAEAVASAAQAPAQAAKPDALAMTPKQYHDAKLKWIAAENDVSLAEVRENYDTEGGRAENENEWVQAVRSAAKDGASLGRATLDKLHEIRPGAVQSIMHDYPDAKLPAGYQVPDARKIEAEEKAARIANRKEVQSNMGGVASAPVATEVVDPVARAKAAGVPGVRAGMRPEFLMQRVKAHLAGKKAINYIAVGKQSGLDQYSGVSEDSARALAEIIDANPYHVDTSDSNWVFDARGMSIADSLVSGGMLEVGDSRSKHVLTGVGKEVARLSLSRVKENQSLDEMLSELEAAGGNKLKPDAQEQKEAATQPVAKESPREGERNAEGLVFRDGRWHRDGEDAPAADAATVAEPEAAAPAHEIIEHVTGKGKTLRGIVRTDISGHDAAAIDPYTFRKNGGWFIREKHLGEAGATAPVGGHAAAPVAAPDPEEQARAAAAAAVAKSKEQAAKLREAGEKLLAESESHYSRDRLTNTARRVRMAANAEANAAEEIRIAKTMINLASAIEDGDARYLAGVNSKAAVKTLEAEVKRCIYEADRNLSYTEQQRNKGRAVTDEDIDNAKFPQPKWGTAGTSLSQVLDAIKGKRGAPALAEKLRYSAGPTPELAVAMRKLLEPEKIKSLLGWWNIERLADMNRLQKLGINNDAQLREALREFIQYRGGHKAVDPIKAAERALVGQKVGVDFFPTPKTLAAAMAESAGIKPGMRVLEPSAGNGHLADAAKAAGADVDTVEISDTLRNILQAKGHNLAGRDFNDFTPAVKYDAVLMNPPFSDRQDAAHIMRAMDMLKPGGQLVAIAGEGVFFGSDKKAVAFRDWLAEHGAEVEQLPPGTFMGADLPAQTSVHARMIKITKAAEAVAAPAPSAAESVQEQGPKDGDRNADGLVFRNGRWHREDVDALRQHAANAQSAADDWAGRKYKKNDATIGVGDDGAEVSIGGINEKRRGKNVDRLQGAADVANKLADRIESGEDFSKQVAAARERAQELSGNDDTAAFLLAEALVGTANVDDAAKAAAAGIIKNIDAKNEQKDTPDASDSTAPDGNGDWLASLYGDGATAAEPTETELAEDREDLATELTRNPHSDKAKELLTKVAAKHAPRPVAEPVDDEDDPNSPNYRYADTGHIAGSRKEEAAANIIQRAKRDGAQVLVQNINWDELEANDREAKELITKNNLFGLVPWDKLRENGMEPGAGFLVDRIYASIAQEPSENNAQARKDYTLGLQTLRGRLESCKTPAQVLEVLDELRNEYDGKMLNAEESQAYQKIEDARKPLLERLRDMDVERNAARKEQSAVRGSEWGPLNQEREKRERRGWKVDPKTLARIAELRPAVEAADKKMEETFSRLYAEERSIRDQLSTLSQMARSVEQGAYVRNKIENPMHRAWMLMGDRFVGVLRFRSMFKASEAFQKHAAAAKNGMVNDWSWLERGGETKAPKVKKESARFQMKVADRYERVGGRPVTAESTIALKNTFNLRDVQSGNWVLRDPISAKFHTEQAAAAFADLADLIGIPDDQISFNGRLALAFGARGKGNTGFAGAAAAHYEPVHRVINMTKMRGGGALAHEWFHAVDNMIKEAVGSGPASVDDFVTEDPMLVPEGPLRDAVMGLRRAMMEGDHQLSTTHQYTAQDYRMAQINLKNISMGSNINSLAGRIKGAADAGAALDSIAEHYKNRMEYRGAKKQRATWERIAIAWHGGNPDGGEVKAKSGPRMSSFKKEAHLLDGGSKNEYWSDVKEMSARAFQSWVEDRMAGMGRKNDYLSWGADNKYHVDPMFGIEWKPFPEGEERERINKAFDSLIAALGQNQVLAKAMALLGREGTIAA